MKKILCIVPYTFLPAETGGQKSIATFYKHLAKRFQVVCIGTSTNQKDKAEGYEVYPALSASPTRYINFINVFTIRNIIKKEKPDYLQFEHPYLGWLAVALKRISGVKLIVRSHNIEGLRFKNLNKWWWWILAQYEGWVHRQADINYFISDVDRKYAIENFHLSPENAYTITFGIDLIINPPDGLRSAARTILINEHGLEKDAVIILFNGAFNYAPNKNALTHLIQHIFPLLKTLSDKNFKLIVCGKDIPKELIENNKDSSIIYAGFVSDINLYLTGSSLFVNPITEGGGIKTKLVEALSYNLNCVSYETGAIGVSKELCGDKLLVVNDHDFKSFSQAILTAANNTTVIPPAFYDYFATEKIVEKLHTIL